MTLADKSARGKAGKTNRAFPSHLLVQPLPRGGTVNFWMETFNGSQ